ncbi:unnamed protein product [Bursaphelenchus okinawaensis]|uniref:SP-RING-type domain-containing protein n=1 Tax=Bursaphelenchus okinawaensis TaxID=465554 RepID=A0A811KJQ1_9BILA|nr:unnamed protein product [Bursaphelenchus okinawaensis]CAG9105129.1 unnamed protein product [Bursaphelenchus okinawaensis]
MRRSTRNTTTTTTRDKRKLSPPSLTYCSPLSQKQSRFGSQTYGSGNILNHNIWEARNLQFEEFPFFITENVIVPPTYLVRPGTIYSDWECSFRIPPEYLSKMDERINGKRVYQLHGRFYKEGEVGRQPIFYPESCDVKVDGVSLPLPDPITVTEGRKKVSRRPPLPVDMTGSFRPFQSFHRVNIRWSHSTTVKFVFTAVLVRSVNVEYLKNKVLEEPRLLDQTKLLIKKNFGDEDGFSVCELRASLLCPYGRIVMNYPSRSLDCSHLQCFDLVNFISVNEKKTNWKCPVCNKTVLFSRLRVDDYFGQIIKDTKRIINEVELFKDGNWAKVGHKDDVVDIDDSDDEDAPSTSQVTVKNVKEESQSKEREPKSEEVRPSAPLPHVPRGELEIITLSDSDDSESDSDRGTPYCNPNEPSTSNDYVANGTSNFNGVMNGNPKPDPLNSWTFQNIPQPPPRPAVADDDEVIVLDSDSEDDNSSPPPPPIPGFNPSIPPPPSLFHTSEQGYRGAFFNYNQYNSMFPQTTQQETPVGGSLEQLMRFINAANSSHP